MKSFKLNLALLKGVFILLSIYNVNAQVPQITSFNPTACRRGDTVIITGQNFSAVSANNFVYFGKVSASVVSSTATSLTVIVPNAAENVPISVTCNGRTGFSLLPFKLLFPGRSIKQSNYPTTNAPILSNSTSWHSLTAADLNRDGYPDLITPILDLSSIWINRHQGTTSASAFAAGQSFPAGIPAFVADYADFDNDGLLDIVTAGQSTSTICVKRNTSTLSTISLSATNILLSLAVFGDTYVLGTADFNNDGLIDIITGANSSNNLSIFLNTTTAIGNITFGNPINISTGFSYFKLITADFNLDGRMDIAAIPISSFGQIIISQNNTTPNSTTLNFTTSAVTTTATFPSFSGEVRAGNINNDNLLDLVVGFGPNIINVFTNQSSLSSINFSTASSISLPNNSSNLIATEDINGDGHTDIAAYGGSQMNILQNRGFTTGLITSNSFLNAVSYSSPWTNQAYGVVADFNNDGAKDFITRSGGDGRYVIREYTQVCDTPSILSQPTTVASCAGDSVRLSVNAFGYGNLTYQWHKNGLPITGATNSFINFGSLTNTDSGSYFVIIRDTCPFNSSVLTSVSNTVRIIFSNEPIIVNQPVPTNSCGGPVQLTINSVFNPASNFQWFRNNVLIPGATNPVYNMARPSSLDSGRYHVRISNNCGIRNSDTVRLSLNLIQRPTVSDFTLCLQSGNITLLNSTPPSSQFLTNWYDDGGLTQLISSSTSSSLSRFFNSQDTIFIRHELNNSTLDGIGVVDHSFLSGDDRSALALNRDYLYYTGDSWTVRYRMPNLTNATQFTIRDGLFSTYADSGTIYSLGSATAPWGVFNATIPATHLHRLDSNLNSVGVIPFTGITSISSSTGSFIASGPNFILYRSGSVLFKINTITGLVTNLSSNITNFSPALAEGWAGWGYVDSINGNHFIYYRSGLTNLQGISIYHVETNTNTIAFNPGTLNVFSDMAALAKAPWYNRIYFKLETGTSSTISLGLDEVLGYCNDPIRFNTAICNSMTDTAVINYTFPVFANQPTPLSTCPLTSAFFRATTTRDVNYTYQWLRNNTIIPGATNDTLIINSVLPSESGQYVLRVSNGCTSVFSNEARLEIRGVSIVNQPSNAFNCLAEPVTVSVNATGNGTITYQWRRNGIPIVGANQASFTIPAITPADTGLYNVIINDSCGFPVTSNNARVYISNGPQITQLSSTQSVCLGNLFTLNVGVIGNGTLNYLWQRNNVVLPNSNSPIYTDSSFSLLDTGLYNVSISDNCGLTTSNNIRVNRNIINPPNVTNLTFCTPSWQTFNNLSTPPSGFITRWYDNPSLTTLNASGSSYQVFLSQTDTFYARNEINLNSISGVGAVDHNAASGDDRGGLAVTRDYFYYVGDNFTVRFRMPNLTNATSLPVRDGIFATYGGNGTLYSFGSSTGPWGAGTTTITHIYQLDSNLNQIGAGVALSTSLAAASGIIAAGPDFVLYSNSIAVYKIIPTTGVVTILSNSTFGLIPNSTENWTSWGFAEIINNNHYIYYRASSFNFNGISRYHVEGQSNSVIFSSPNSILGDMAVLSNAPWYNRWYFHFEGNAQVLGATTFTNEAAIFCDAPMRFANAGCVSEVDTVIATINTVTITQQPQGITTCAGNPITLSVNSTGINLTYQWRRNGINIPGANSRVLTLNNVSILDTGNYSVVISNSCGNFTSANALLRVRGVQILSQPLSIRVCNGNPVNLSVTATGIGQLNYQWFRNGTPITGATSNSFFIPSLTNNDTGRYTVQITDSCGLPVTSNNAVVSLSNGPTINSLSNANALCLGSNTSLSVTATFSGTPTYQWRRNGINIPGANSNTFSIVNFGFNDTGNYTVVITDLCGQTTSQNVRLSPLLEPAPTVNNATTCITGTWVTLTNTTTPPTGFVTRWYDDAALTVLLGQGANLSRIVNSFDLIYVRNENPNGCVSLVDTVTISITNTNTWTGNINTNWFNTGNWSCGSVPTATTSAIIPSGVTNMPNVVSGLTANVFNLTINNGATLNLQGTSTLNIHGDLTRNGIINLGTSTIGFLKSTDTTCIPRGVYHNLTLGTNISGALLRGSIIIENNVNFTGSNIVRLDTSNVTMLNYLSTAVNGAGTNAYFSTNGSGRLRLPGVGTGATRGTSAFAYIGNASYNPVGITNTGTIDTFEFQVLNNVFPSYNNFIPSSAAFTNNAVNRTWIIRETNQGGSTLLITPGWSNANELSGFNRNACYVAQYISNMWNNGVAGTSALNNGINFRPQGGYTTDGIFGVGSNNVLPVGWLSFSANAIGENGHLVFRTAWERNCKFFEIEASADGKNYSTIGKLDAIGNSTTTNQYNFTHFNAVQLARNIYYRIKQVDYNGDFTYSMVVNLQFSTASFTVKANPNPFRSQVSIIVEVAEDCHAELNLKDVNGKNIQNHQPKLIRGSNIVLIDQLETLSPGVYFIQLITDKGDYKTIKVVKD